MSLPTAIFAIPDLISAKNRYNQNALQAEGLKNMYNAFTSNDPEVRETANKRYLCSNKFGTKQFKYVGFGLLLPMLIVVIYLMIYDRIDQEYKEIINSASPLFAIWIVIGVCMLLYNGDEWTRIQTTINRATGPVLDNCEKLFSHM